MPNLTVGYGKRIAAEVEHGSNFGRELFQSERFLQEIVLDIDHFMVQHRLPGVTRDK
jgi:hypothetical protein